MGSKDKGAQVVGSSTLDPEGRSLTRISMLQEGLSFWAGRQTGDRCLSSFPLLQLGSRRRSFGCFGKAEAISP